jgi:hypothetical protein
MHWQSLWTPAPADFRLTQMLFSLVMALLIGMGAIPRFRPYMRRVGLPVLALFAAFVLGLILWRALYG